MSFEHAPVSKGLMMGCALTSIVGGIFDVKHYLHLQFVPHISRHHQYWRLLVHHLAFSSSSDLLIAELLLYNAAVQIERQFGSVKFASFAIASLLLTTTLEFLSLLLLHWIGLNHIPAGSITLVFSILYQWFRIVPPVYHFRVFGVSVSNKIFTYVLASQLAIGHLPGSFASALIGILSGLIYRSDFVNLKSWRLSPSVIRFARRFILPVIGSTRSPRRSNRARPDIFQATSAPTSASLGNEEVITTARPTITPVRNRNGEPGVIAGTGSSVMREWVNELTGRTEQPGTGTHVPSETEIGHLTGIFPDIQRDVIVGTLQRSPNIERAVETLLRSSG
ncbi:hypothetical protein BJ138DRAFT_1147175 [Hygrophoropsis aurantiaca]|uniref:Uncharacterized protein n=1 Tax=Hygrophoropsis aurantiaca TaxID=72124 RepID=A0ACB8AHN0_9AGAM|nr:hypothetical protein BJ138DRAFT_1147175 [Hygrophoropsis aurantiaca]